MNFDNSIKMRGKQDDYKGFGTTIGIWKKEDDKYFVAKPIEWEEKKQGEAINDFIYLNEVEAQQFMDSLWQTGLRPTDRTYGSIEATGKHLEDMRKIAFHKLGIEK